MPVLALLCNPNILFLTFMSSPWLLETLRAMASWISARFQSDLQAEIERKSYDSCLDHADELQALVDQWRSLEVFTTTQLSETDRAILKALPVLSCWVLL